MKAYIRICVEKNMSDFLNNIKLIFKLYYYDTFEIVWSGWLGGCCFKKNIKNKIKIK